MGVFSDVSDVPSTGDRDGGVVTRLLLFCANGGAAGPCVSSESAVGTGGSGAAAAEFGAVGQHRGEAVGPRRGV